MSAPRVPTEVSEELTTVELRVVPVRVPAGAVPVMFPVRLPVALVKKSEVANKLVVVALVEVLLREVKFWRVVELLTKSVLRVEEPVVKIPVLPRKPMLVVVDT